MIRDILKMGDPRLLRVAPPVAAERLGSPELKALIQDLFETMAAASGVGLAAPQIGEDLQLMVFGFERNARYPHAAPVPLQVLINPRIEVLDATEELGWEGCLSIPGLRGEVPRARRIRYRGVDGEGRPVEQEAEGFHARVVLHEYDHLIGRLYPSRIQDFARFGFSEVLFPELEPAAQR
ncbi:peptide deformylase [Pseudomonas oryzihabitans]|uniref:peptide deformylase n=1 Tax=Pseudomonas rhizoryzae TaxID=2571129 RepID=UPI0007364CD4|nr:peptide deformylase [Pseudomonas rhizoryzae]APQ14234.1 peptide deformylase [Pseudomonas psychrotolerans]KTS78993.1 peptide deformylase [Pseudomonas psychrotolerans]KTT04545.1 peptide deformylase [Pseudomonas psychrotolerans]KTT13194.1 peptide deformylase [Pseudomonas psychrotolerans]KTT24885.1 peptide deformylase [Pseudomonas psychrotolerans]